MQIRKRDTDAQNRLLDSVGEGEGGMFLENSIETSILSRVKQITSPGWMHETSARAWCSGKTQRDRVEREVGGGIGMGIHVTPWLIHVNVWQNPLQYCKVISLKLIKINEKKKGYWSGLPFPSPTNTSSDAQQKKLAFCFISLHLKWPLSSSLFSVLASCTETTAITSTLDYYKTANKTFNLNWFIKWIIHSTHYPLEEVMTTSSSILAWRVPVDRGAWRVTKSRTRLND